jgi:hypothetical protein
MRSRLGVLDITSRADARIRRQQGQRLAIDIFTLALNILLVPFETEPFQILERRLRRPRLVARMIEILDAENHLPAERSRAEIGDHKSPDVA